MDWVDFKSWRSAKAEGHPFTVNQSNRSVTRTCASSLQVIWINLLALSQCLGANHLLASVYAWCATALHHSERMLSPARRPPSIRGVWNRPAVSRKSAASSSWLLAQLERIRRERTIHARHFAVPWPDGHRPRPGRACVRLPECTLSLRGRYGRGRRTGDSGNRLRGRRGRCRQGGNWWSGLRLRLCTSLSWNGRGLRMQRNCTSR